MKPHGVHAKSGYALALSLAVTLALLAVMVPCAIATELLTEDFTVAPEPGDPGEAPGREGPGWFQPALGHQIEYPIDLGKVTRGVISFNIQRIETDRPTTENTVFELIGPDRERVFRMRVVWVSDFDPTRSAVKFLSDDRPGYYDMGLGLWDPEILLDRQPQVGEWVHFDIVWDDEAKIYGLYVDGRPQDVHPGTLDRYIGSIIPDERLRSNRSDRENGFPESYQSRPFSWFLDKVATFQLGLLDRKVPDKERRFPLLASAIVDDVRVLVNEIASIRTVSHDAREQAGYSGKLISGQTVTVTLDGYPGGTATFDLGDIRDLPMTENAQRAGRYTGAYTVKWGDLVEAGQVVGHLRRFGFDAKPVAAARAIDIDGRVHMAVNPANDLLPADRSSRSGLTVVARDANDKAVRDHQLKFTVSTTDEYTGTVGGGSFEDAVGGSLEVDWNGITDSFGEATAQYVSGFAAKTILISAKDMVSGDVGIGWVRSFIDGTVDIVVKRPEAAALAFVGTMEITASRTWLTADGRSRSRITVVVRDETGNPMAGHNIQFSMAGDNGSLRVIQARTDSRGRAYADYVAGIVMGQVTIEAVDTTSGLSGSIVIELRPDAPAEIKLVADPPEVLIGGEGATVTATVKDINGNPNRDVDVVYDISMGEGTLAFSIVATNEKGVAAVKYTPGATPGVVTVRGTVTSRVPTAEELSAAAGAVFLYGLGADPGPLTVGEWKVKAGDEVTRGQELVALTDHDGVSYAIKAPRGGKVSVFAAEEGDEVNYGDTLGYILLAEEKK